MIACLKISSFEVPSLLVPGDSAYLTCLFDLGGEKLYSVKWYKNDQEFYRFFPSLNPQYMAFRAPGIHVDSVAPCQCSRHVLVFLRDCLKTSKSLFADVENDHHCAPVSKLRKANRSRTTGISTVLIDCGKLGSRSERSSENNSVRNEDRLVLPQMDFVNDQLTLTQPSLSETDSITWCERHVHVQSYPLLRVTFICNFLYYNIFFSSTAAFHRPGLCPRYSSI
ncbi:uncharacterized protein TNCV_4077041 [Trichonephila clavipes]|nr:uncharacterized protein TNCV_4077041 [Trichonephila clavipes]